MVTQKTRWQIKNTTVRPPRIDPKTKQDVRTAIERVGYSVSWREENTPNRANVVLGPGQLKIVSEITDGMINLNADGLISIEEFANVSDVLAAHTAQGGRTARRGASKPATENPESPSTAQGRRQARAAEMGDAVTNKEARAEHIDAVNPSGTPNFVVNAPSDETRRKQKQPTPTL